MKLLKLTALTLSVSFTLFAISSCESDAEMKKTTDYQKNGIVITGANEYPATASTALGKLDVYYTKETRILTYTLNWSGLSGAVTAIHINGLAPLGYGSPLVVQTLTNGSIVKCPTSGNTSCGTYTGTLMVDGVVVKEADLLNGQYYLHIHTAAYPASSPLDGRGEIRAQIMFQ